jgi:peptide deformylase
MTIRTILHYPDPRLRRKANPVPEVNDDIRRLVDDMAETMYQAPGIGLAAIQVNEAWRIVVIDISETAINSGFHQSKSCSGKRTELEEDTCPCPAREPVRAPITSACVRSIVTANRWSSRPKA